VEPRRIGIAADSRSFFRDKPEVAVGDPPGDLGKRRRLLLDGYKGDMDVQGGAGILRQGVTNPDRALLLHEVGLYTFRVTRAVRGVTGDDSMAAFRGVRPAPTLKSHLPSGLMLGLVSAMTTPASNCPFGEQRKAAVAADASIFGGDAR
jgi:hypothetical protein